MHWRSRAFGPWLIACSRSSSTSRQPEDTARPAGFDRFILYLHYMDVHDHLLWQRSYSAMVARTDAAIGRFIEGLEILGLLEDAVVILVSDPGEARDVMARHSELTAAHRARMHTLSERLASESRPDDVLRDEDRRCLEALGYLE